MLQKSGERGGEVSCCLHELRWRVVVGVCMQKSEAKHDWSWTHAARPASCLPPAVPAAHLAKVAPQHGALLVVRLLAQAVHLGALLEGVHVALDAQRELLRLLGHLLRPFDPGVELPRAGRLLQGGAGEGRQEGSPCGPSLAKRAR